jgi:hypothetical protein
MIDPPQQRQEGAMQHYYVVAEPDEAGGFWISFPGRDGIASAASSAIKIVGQARDALESLMYPPADHGPAGAHRDRWNSAAGIYLVEG